MKNRKWIRLIITVALLTVVSVGVLAPVASAKAETEPDWFALSEPTGQVAPNQLRDYWNRVGWPTWCTYVSYTETGDGVADMPLLTLGITAYSDDVEQCLRETLGEGCFVKLVYCGKNHDELDQIYSELCRKQQRNPVYNEILVMGDHIMVVTSDLFIGVCRKNLQKQYGETVDVTSKLGAHNDIGYVDNYGFEFQRISDTQPWFEVWLLGTVVIIVLCVVFIAKYLRLKKR